MIITFSFLLVTILLLQFLSRFSVPAWLKPVIRLLFRANNHHEPEYWYLSLSTLMLLLSLVMVYTVWSNGLFLTMAIITTALVLKKFIGAIIYFRKASSLKYK